MIDVENSYFYRVSFGRYLKHVASDSRLPIIVTPKAVDYKAVEAAWSYALRHSAKGIDIPDVQAAIKLLLERHPDWQVVPYFEVRSIAYNPENVEK